MKKEDIVRHLQRSLEIAEEHREEALNSNCDFLGNQADRHAYISLQSTIQWLIDNLENED